MLMLMGASHLSESLIDLLLGLVLGDAVDLSDLLCEGALVTSNGGEVSGAELVELGSDLCLGSFVGHGDWWV